MAQMLLLDVDEILEVYKNRAINILNEISDEDEVSEFTQGQLAGLAAAGEILVEYLHSSVKFVQFPKSD